MNSRNTASADRRRACSRVKSATACERAPSRARRTKSAALLTLCWTRRAREGAVAERHDDRAVSEPCAASNSPSSESATPQNDRSSENQHTHSSCRPRRACLSQLQKASRSRETLCDHLENDDDDPFRFQKRRKSLSATRRSRPKCVTFRAPRPRPSRDPRRRRAARPKEEEDSRESMMCFSS